MTTNSYYVVMIDYPGEREREAVVNPEVTRREIIARINRGEYPRDRISFIDHIDGNYKETVTAEILAECEPLETSLSPADMIDAQRDHARALRNEVMS